jgi:hypothetical protein
MAIKEVRKVLPFLQYFVKNGGLNTVTGAASAGFIPLLVEVLNNPAVDQGVQELSGGSVVGAVIASIVIALRAGLGFWRSIK